MILFKKEMKKELLDGRSIRSIAKKSGVCEAYMSEVLNGKRTCSKKLVKKILDNCNQEKNYSKFFEIVDFSK